MAKFRALHFYVCFFCHNSFVQCNSFDRYHDDPNNSKAINHNNTKVKEIKIHHDRKFSVNGNWSSVEIMDQRALQNIPYEIITTLPHKKSSFTQGLSYSDNVLIEGTGKYGFSRLMKIDPSTGEIVQSTPYMDRMYFGEGITHYVDRKRNKRIIQITWKSGEGFIYTPDLQKIDSFFFQTTRNEGWGITHDRKRSFIVSDGSEFLHFWNDETLKQIRKVPVTYRGKKIDDLNELEYVNGRVLANRRYSDNIYNIDPKSGEVMKVYDFSSLRKWSGVLNGISVSDKSGELFVTGKNWPQLYRIKLLDCWDDDTWYFRRWKGQTCETFLKKAREKRCKLRSRRVRVRDSCCLSCSS
mmetsp:Transcript_28068/g.64252  ORF Transcript_28068/g.64252 Transcript_28068/m.64252 type:complete len:354 (-) Transcript_28068:144-1205(-)